MKTRNLLIVIGEDIDANSSTNVFKRSIIGCLSKDNNVTVAMYKPGNERKNNDAEIEGVTYKVVSGNYLIQAFLRKMRRSKIGSDAERRLGSDNKKNIGSIRAKYICLTHPIYRYYSYFLKGLKYVGKDGLKQYDAVISISHPPVAHEFAYRLLKEKNFSGPKWIQIWFEPWYLVPTKPKESRLIRLYMKKLMKHPDRIYINGEIHRQRLIRQFPKYEDRLNCIPLPAEEIPGENIKAVYKVGYFGEYKKDVRNIIPLAKAMDEIGNSIIVGNGDYDYSKTRNVTIISKRISIDECMQMERETAILTVILNKDGDAIPGKIYKYGMFKKPILVILDGSEEYKTMIKNEFQRYPKYRFCENNTEDILGMIEIIEREMVRICLDPIDDFSVTEITKRIFAEK